MPTPGEAAAAAAEATRAFDAGMAGAVSALEMLRTSDPSTLNGALWPTLAEEILLADSPDDFLLLAKRNIRGSPPSTSPLDLSVQSCTPGAMVAVVVVVEVGVAASDSSRPRTLCFACEDGPLADNADDCRW